MKSLREIEQKDIDNIVKLLGYWFYGGAIFGYSRDFELSKKDSETKLIIQHWAKSFVGGQWGLYDKPVSIIEINLLENDKVKVLVDYNQMLPRDTVTRNLLVNENFKRKFQERVLDYLTKKGYIL